MQKNRLALAVSCALGTMLASSGAQSQNATVNVYGTLYGEYSRISNGKRTAAEPYQNYDHWQNPGSNIGFRGEEKLGGGLSAWFQCESTIDYRGPGNRSATNSQNSGFCTRNSALGFKGGFGNVFYGNWQTPWTRINSQGNVGSNDTGVFGNAHMIAGASSTFGISAPQQTNPVAGATGVTTAAINTTNAGAFRRRQNNLFTYETPNFAGFSAMGAFTTRNYASAATNAQFKTRLWSVGAQYANGPIYVGAAYEKHSDFIIRAPAASGVAGDVKGWTVAWAYTFPINLKLGGSYQQFKSQSTTTADAKVNTLHLGIDWKISGPHGVRAGWSHAFNVKGPSGTPFNVRPAANPNSGANMYQIRYVHALSKRTEVTAGFSRTINKANANYETGGGSTSRQLGSDSSAFAVAVRHSF